MFYGWVIVAVSLLAQFIATGLPFYSFGPIMKALEDDLGATRTQVAFSMSLMATVPILAGPLAGWLVDRGAIRRVMFVGGVALALGIWLLARVDSVWQLWLVYSLPVPLGMALLGGVANARLITNWFYQRRGLALGFAMMGISLAGMAVPVAMGEMVASMGWRSAILSLVVLPLIFLPLLLLVHDEPAHRGLYPDGMAHLPLEATPVARDPGFWSVLRAPATWLIALCFAPLLAANSGMVVQIYEHARDLGLERAEAGLAVTAMAVGGAVGKPIYGRVADFIGPRRALLFAIGLMVLGLALFLAATGLASLMLAGAVFGFGFSGLVVLQAVLAAEIFGREVLGRVLGVIGWGIFPLVFFVNPLLGWIHDSTGSYALAFQILMAGCGLSALLLALIPRAQPAEAASSSPA